MKVGSMTVFVYPSYCFFIALAVSADGGEFLALVVICTVFLSLVAHGITANPLAKWLGKKESENQGEL